MKYFATCNTYLLCSTIQAKMEKKRIKQHKVFIEVLAAVTVRVGI